MRVKCLAKEHNTMSLSGLEPGPLDPEFSMLATRPPRLPHESDHPIIMTKLLWLNLSGWTVAVK